VQESALKNNHPESSPPVRARLKWFNSPKGFGFLVPANEPDLDAFIHITALQKAGIKMLGQGAEILCHIEHGPKGAIVTEVVDIIAAGEEPLEIPDKIEESETINLAGTVKWFKPEKGFGFVLAEDGKKDVFIHQSCLDKFGIPSLESGQELRMLVRNVSKGREAIEISLLGE
jgi:CspA family cold shock protein